jgi:predicted short-subunit dehydrogenase-like oxidoreductase (DUF2520 family)
LTQHSAITAGIAGTGNLAQALGRALTGRGVPIPWIAGRDPGRTVRAARFIGPEVEPVSFESLARHAGRVLIVVSDRAIGEVAGALAAAAQTPAVALHCAGGVDVSVLEPLQARGSACGSFHPLQSICDPAQGAAALPGSAFTIAGDPRAAEWAHCLSTLLDGVPLHVPPDARPRYHAAAVFASNYAAALLDGAQALLADAAGIEPAVARRALAPLVRASVDNILERGPEAALTGPIARGDAATIAIHLVALAGNPLQDLYRAVGRHTLTLARRKGLASEAAAAIELLLEGNRIPYDQTG